MKANWAIAANIVKRMTPKQRKEYGVLTPDACVAKADEREEALLQNDCENKLRSLDIAFLHLSIRAREKKGWPDLVFVRPVRIPTAVELKSATGTLSNEQECMLANMRRDGWDVYVMSRYEDFVRLFK